MVSGALGRGNDSSIGLASVSVMATPSVDISYLDWQACLKLLKIEERACQGSRTTVARATLATSASQPRAQKKMQVLFILHHGSHNSDICLGARLHNRISRASAHAYVSFDLDVVRTVTQSASQ